MGSARGLSGLGFGAQPMGYETRKVAWARETGERHLPKWLFAPGKFSSTPIKTVSLQDITDPAISKRNCVLLFT